MATLCKNCSYPLVFDPESQKLICNACGSSCNAEDDQAQSHDHRQDLAAESYKDVYGSDEKDMMDCYIYSCSECGGEIIINGTEASTQCFYCGNSVFVFNRIAKQKCPEYILPFSITKEQALESIHQQIDKGIFIPKEIKNFTVDSIRGSYIPYWIVNADYTDSVVIQGRVKSGKNSVTRFFGRAGNMRIRNLPLDASTALSDESSSRLEPFYLKKLKPFDEDYMAGFYSNVSDVTYSNLRKATLLRAKEYFDEEAMADVRAGIPLSITSYYSWRKPIQCHSLPNNLIYCDYRLIKLIGYYYRVSHLKLPLKPCRYWVSSSTLSHM